MRKIKLIAAVAFFSLAFAGNTNAQTEAQVEKATRQTERMSTELSLSEEQKTQVQSVNLGIIMKNDGIRSMEGMSQEEKTSAINSNNEARKEMMRGILTPEQFTKFEEISTTRPGRSEMQKLEMPKEKKVIKE